MNNLKTILILRKYSIPEISHRKKNRKLYFSILAVLNRTGVNQTQEQ